MIALVTGTSSGFGMRIALKLAEQGCHVVATMRDLSRKDNLLEQAAKRNVADRMDILRLDVTDGEAAGQVVRQIIEKHGRIDVLVNNAGYAQGGMIEEVPLSDWRAQMETNFFAAVRLTQLVIPHMRKQRSGVVVNISSVNGRMPLPGFGPYSASKFALEAFSESLRLELSPFGIRVVLIEPGAYRTDIWSKGFGLMHAPEDSPYKEMREAIFAMARQSAEQAPDPGEVADRIASLLQQPNPPLRHLLGRGIRAGVTARSLLPWNWYERMIHRILGKVHR